MRNKERLILNKRRITLCILGVLLAVLTAVFRGEFPIEGHAHTVVWHDKTAFIPMPVRIVNGGFEIPHIRDTAEHLVGENEKDSASTDYLRAWNILFINRGYIQIKKHLRSDPQGIGEGQYAVLKESQDLFLFQEIETSPGSRLYYGFRHRGEGSGESVLDTYIYQGGERPRDASYQSRSGSEWTSFVSRYIVPEGQTRTVFGFAPGEGGGRNIVLLDNIWAKTGASLIVDKTSDKDGSGYLQAGDVINYTILLRNYGQIEASKLAIEDVLTGDVEFLGITETENIDVESAIFDESEGKLSFGISPSEYLEGVEDQLRGNIAKIQYRVKVKSINHPMINSQAVIRYNDKGFENMNGNESGFSAYSNVHGIQVQEPSLATSSVAVSLLWRGGETQTKPSSVGVRLYKNGEEFSDIVELSEENAWSYVWENLEENILQTASLASDSNTPRGEEKGELYDWSVKQVDYLSEYNTREERIGENIWLITNTYKEDIQKESIPRIRGGDGHINSESGALDSAGDISKKNKIALQIEQSASEDIDAAAGGSEVGYTIRIKNVSERGLRGIWIRAYMPEYTHFSETEFPGEYGCIEGREHVTWFIPHIAEKEEMELGFKVNKDYCVGGKITNEIFYEITDSEEKPYANCAKGPESSFY